MPKVAIGMLSTAIACQMAHKIESTPTTEMMTYDGIGDVPMRAGSGVIVMFVQLP